MTTIIKFPTIPRQRSLQDKGNGAKIILFPGVRYERLENAPSQKARGARRRKKA